MINKSIGRLRRDFMGDIASVMVARDPLPVGIRQQLHVGRLNFRII